VIKAHVAKTAGGGAKAHKLHLDYIERDGVELDGSPGRMYSADPDTLARAREPVSDNEPHVFRFVISPEEGAELDLTAFAAELVRESEKAVGRRFVWCAVNHYDTDNPHVHLVIRGLDRHGDQLRLDPRFISHGMRHRAQRIATLELGERTDLQMRRQLAREIVQERWTSLDRELEQFLEHRTPDAQRRPATTELELAAIRPKDLRRREALIGRIQTLEKLGLVTRLGSGRWRFEGHWKEGLKALSVRGDVVARIHAALKRGGDTARYHDGPPAGEVDAVVRKKGLLDELTGRQYVVLETPRGDAYHVPVPAYHAELLAEGQVVRVSRRPAPRATEIVRQLCSFARTNGGAFDLAAFVAASRGTESDSAKLRASAERALKGLERERYLERAGEGVWRAAPGKPDLYAVLLSADAKAPIYEPRLRVQAPNLVSMVFEPRFTWLDEQLANTRAPFGLGAELEDVLERRRTFLRKNLGLDPSDPNLRLSLKRAERRRETAAASTLLRGATYVRVPPEGLTGRLVSSRSARFLCVYDEPGKRFTLISASSANRALLDQMVTVVRDGEGRVSLSAASLSRSL